MFHTGEFAKNRPLSICESHLFQFGHLASDFEDRRRFLTIKDLSESEYGKALLGYLRGMASSSLKKVCVLARSESIHQ